MILSLCVVGLLWLVLKISIVANGVMYHKANGRENRGMTKVQRGSR